MSDDTLARPDLPSLQYRQQINELVEDNPHQPLHRQGRRDLLLVFQSQDVQTSNAALKLHYDLTAQSTGGLLNNKQHFSRHIPIRARLMKRDRIVLPRDLLQRAGKLYSKTKARRENTSAATNRSLQTVESRCCPPPLNLLCNHDTFSILGTSSLAIS